MSAQQKKPPFTHGQPSMGLPFQKELVVNLFAGGGGASTGINRAYHVPDVAVNYNPIALAVHRANHHHECLFKRNLVMSCHRFPILKQIQQEYRNFHESAAA